MQMQSLSGAIAAVIFLTQNPDAANAQACADAVGVSIGKKPSSLPIVEHTTGKGKVIRGVIRTDLNHAQAKEIDPYTFRKSGGYFIREKYLSEMGDVAFTPEASSVEGGVQKAQEQTEEQKQAIAQEQAAAKQEQARARSAERLRGVAEKMLADAQGELGRERLTNTRKRAGQAASSIADATRASGIAKTMGNLADAIASGQAENLAGLTSRTQVELLDGMIRHAQYERWRAEGKNYAETERLKGTPLTEQDVAFTKMPEVSTIKSHAESIAAALAGLKGYTKASAWAYGKAKSTWSDGRIVVDPSEYEMVKTVLKGLDSIGKKQIAWNLIDSMAHVDRLSRMGIKNTNDLHAALKEYLQFRDGGIKEDPVKAAERKLVGQKVGIDFFPTPKSLAQRMVEMAGIEQGDRVLEPSAGSGNIADAAKAAGAKVDTIEVSHQLRELLGLKGHTVIGNDFEMEDYSGRYYDAVLMNPPFSDRKDALHIMRAFDLLKKGGTLVAIAGEGVFFGSDAKAVGFRDWLKEHKAHIEKLPEGTFMDKTLLATTGANARLIVMTRRTATGDVTSDDHLQDAGGAVAAADAQDTDATLKRTRSPEAVMFSTPYVGKTGASLVGYDWKNRPEEFIDSRGNDRVQRVSDWEQAVKNIATGRDIVHHFIVVGVDGIENVVSAETAATMLGVSETTVRSNAASLLGKAIRDEKAKAQAIADADDLDAAKTFDNPADAVEADRQHWIGLLPKQMDALKDWSKSNESQLADRKLSFFVKNGRYVFSSPGYLMRDGEPSNPVIADRGWKVVNLSARNIWPVSENNDAFALAAQTEEDLRQKEAADKAALAKEEQERIAAERKAKADRDAADFQLTGSNRPADVAMAGGQADLFAPKTRGQKAAENGGFTTNDLGLHIMENPNGSGFSYVGKVPDVLSYEDGYSQEKADNARQFGERFGPKKRAPFPTWKAAADFAKSKGFEVIGSDPDAGKNLPKTEDTITDADYAQVVEAAKYLKDIVYSLDNLLGDDDRLLLSLSSPLGKSGRDTILMDTFGIDRNLAHTIHNRMDDSKPHKLRDIDMTDAFDTFPMLKKIIDDTKEELRLRDERKAAKEVKNATLTDDMDPNSPNYRYRDTGYVAATRKEQAQSQIRIARDSGQQVTLQMIDWEAIEENPRVAKELIIKSNLFGKVDWEALKAAGMTPEAGFLIDRVYASIAPEPEGEGTQTRRNYALGLQSLRDRLESCKTVQQVTDVLEEVREELTGFQLSSDEEAEYTALDEQYSALVKEEQALEDQSKEPYSRQQQSWSEMLLLEREADKRARRGWKPEPGSAEKIAAAKKQHADDERAWRDILNANKPRREEIRQQRTELSKQRRTIKENAQKRNLMESPATLGWITFGKRFFSLLHWRRSSGSDTFAGHVVNAKAGRIGGWEWAEKDRATKTVKEPTKKEVRFHLKVTEKFDRKGGKPVSVVTTEDLQKTFGLRHIVSGNWVLKDPLSAKFHVENAAGAFLDMGDMLGIDPSVLGLGGRLALGFGAFGKGNAGFGGAAAAHYDPTHRVINLTKMKGGGALGHEYFHALDNLIHEMVNGKVSEKGDQFVSITPELVPAGPLRDAFAELRVAMLTGDVRLNESITLKPGDKRLAAHNIDSPRGGPIAQAIKDAGGLEAAVMAVRAKILPIDKRREKIRNDWVRIAVAYYSPEGTTEVMVPTGPKVSSFKAEAVILDQGVTDKYWSQSNEMASRAFQAYLEDRLASADRRNDYLSAYADNKHYVDPFEGDKKPFPEGEERKRINAAFDKMFDVIRNQQILEKAAANKPLMDAMFPDFESVIEMMMEG